MRLSADECGKKSITSGLSAGHECGQEEVRCEEVVVNAVECGKE